MASSKFRKSRFASFFVRWANTTASGEMAHDDHREVELNAQRLEILDALINSPTLISVKGNTISKQREVVCLLYTS